MSKRTKEENKMPELYINGEKVKFHYNREERRAKKAGCSKSESSFFNKNNRYMHIVILDLIFIMIIALIFYVTVGKAKGHIEDGFKFYFTKKIINDSPFLDLRMTVKNITKSNKSLSEDYRGMELKIFNENGEDVYNKELYIKKQQYKPDEYFTEYILINKPEKGKYKAIIYYGPGKNKNLALDFLIK